MYIITIDGPASSGKSTVAKIVADMLKIAHINSGQAYRAIAYFMLNSGIASTDTESVNNSLKCHSFKMAYTSGNQVVLVNGEDVTNHLHTNQINEVVSQYAQNPQVIHTASDMVREVTQNMSVVMEGRNLGSFCFPEAKYKFFVDCDIRERATRRFKEMQQKGVMVDFDTIYKQVAERDRLDKTRKVAPLVVPKNCILIDSTNLTAEQVAQKIVDFVLDNENKSYS